jgi:hypothetical protein
MSISPGFHCFRHIAQSLLSTLTLGVLGVFIHAQEPAPSAQPVPYPEVYPAFHSDQFLSSPQVCIDVLMVWLPEAKALSLLPALRDPQRIAAAQQRLLAMIAAKDAHFVDWPEVTTHTGKRAMSETVIEKRYPEAFENPPAAPRHPSVPLSEAERKADELSKLGVIVPTDFESKNLGTTLEVEPTLQPGNQSVVLQMRVEHTTFERMQDIPAGHNAKGEPRTVQQPVFRTLRVDSSFLLRDGERRLLHIAKPLEPAGRVYFFIVGASIIPPAAAPTARKP